MEHDQRARRSFSVEPTFRADLQPLYDLSVEDYQAVVLGLSNLMVAIVQELHTRGQSELAQQIATQAHGVLLDYDDDVAGVIHEAGQPPQHRRPLPLVAENRLG
jgi:hypothetical protein